MSYPGDLDGRVRLAAFAFLAERTRSCGDELPYAVLSLRYLAGVYVGAVTGGLWWAIPRIERRAVAVRIAAGAVFLGGIGRCVSMAAVGNPGDPTMVGGLVLELGVVPVLVLWQRRIARTGDPEIDVALRVQRVARMSRSRTRGAHDA